MYLPGGHKEELTRREAFLIIFSSYCAVPWHSLLFIRGGRKKGGLLYMCHEQKYKKYKSYVWSQDFLDLRNILSHNLRPFRKDNLTENAATDLMERYICERWDVAVYINSLEV